MSLPNTEQRIIPRIQHGQRPETHFIVVHITDGDTAEGAMSWWAQPGHEADGAHLIIDHEKAYQTAPLDALCWHAGAANRESVGIEHVGMGSDGANRTWWLQHMTMLHLSANRCAWLHHQYGLGRPAWEHTIFPHGYGGAAWGGHPDCPGSGFPHDVYVNLVHDAYMGHWGRK